MPEEMHEQWFEVLRQRALQVLQQHGQLSAGPLLEIQEVLQELRIYHIELQMQNDELLRSRREVEAERDRFMDLYDAVPVGCLTIDREGHILDANRVSRDMLTEATYPLRGRSLVEFVVPEDQDARYVFVRRVFQSGVPQQAELRFWRPDGGRFVAQVEAHAVPRGGTVEETCRLVFWDITARKQAEEALRLQRDWLDVTLSSLGEGVIATDTHGTITLLNRAAEALTGWTAQEALGCEAAKVLPLLQGQNRRPVEHPVLGVLKVGTVIELAPHTILVPRHGPERLVAGHSTPMRRSDGTLHGVVIILRDITQQLQVEEALSRARNIESLGVLAGGIAHDFNNLLTGILGNVSLAKRFAGRDTTVVTRLTAAETACQRATALTQQLLTFAQGGAPVRQTVSLTELIRETVTFALHGTTACPEISVAADLWPVEADVGQLHQVLHNIVLNAAQAMPDGGQVQVRGENVVVSPGQIPSLPAGRYLRLTVVDHGHGIAAEVLPYVFDPYFTTREQGSGLGLTTAYAIVAKHAGTITIASAVGRGTTVSIYLPASEHSVRPLPEGPTLSQSRSGSILVVDDEDFIRDLLSEILTSLGYTAVCTAHGHEAITLYTERMATGQRFTAVILDLTIPGGMGGKDIVAQLRAVDPQVKAIVSSGYANDPIMSDYGQYGFSGVMVKPYTIEHVHAALQYILQQ